MPKSLRKTAEINMDWTPLPNLFDMIVPLSQKILESSKLSDDYEILRRRFGLEGGKSYTLEEIGAYKNISRERVRQRESRALRLIRNSLLGDPGNPVIHPEAVIEWKSLNDEFRQIGPIIIEFQVLDFLGNRYQIPVDTSKVSILHFLLELQGFRFLSDPRLGFKANFYPTWITVDTFQKDMFVEAQRAVVRSLYTDPAPIDLFDLTVKVNKGRSKKIAVDLLRLAITTSCDVECVPDGKYQIKFISLKSLADKAYQILYLAEKPIELRDLHNEIQHRLAIANEKLVTIESLSNQLTLDKRFTTPGKGLWYLTEWKHTASSTIVKLIKEFFYIKNSDQSVEDVYRYVSDKRPDISKRSISVYLSNKESFTRVSKKTYAPVEWNKKPYLTGREPRITRQPVLREKVTKEVIRLVDAQPNDRMKLLRLRQMVVEITKCKPGTFYQYLSDMENLGLIVKEDINSEMFCRLPSSPSLSFWDSIRNSDWEIIIKDGETKQIEFKIGAKWNAFDQKEDPEMVKKVIKEVAGFMNSDCEGAIFIGVDDTTYKIEGIDKEIHLTGKKKANRDGYALWLSNKIKDTLGHHLLPYYDIVFQKIQGKEVCCVLVKPSEKLVYYQNEVYVRGPSQTVPLKVNEIIEYNEHRGNNKQSI